MKKCLLILWVLFLSGCGKKDNAIETTLPSNLVVTVTAAIDGSGKVDVKATASNTNYFLIYFGDVSAETPVQSNDGTETHSYSTPGTYTIKVEAHATATAFIDKSQDVTPSITIDTDGYTTPMSYDGMTLVWKDEFDGTALNGSDWSYETGNNNGWGNNELETYTTTNATVANGFLTITANSDKTSSRIKTAGKQSFQYGRIDIRAKLPKGQGIWPALWMLGDDFATVNWPKCGEIDIMELIGGNGSSQGNDKIVYGTPHWWDDTQGIHASAGGSYSLTSGIFADKFHVFSLVWDASSIKWYVDDVKYHTLDITPANLSEFKASFFFIFNVAIGGQWPGNPDSSTTYPQKMVVDYVRVFQP